MRGAEQTILPSVTVQTEHPSVKSMQDGLSLTNSVMLAAFSDALSSAIAARCGNAKTGSQAKTTKMKPRTRSEVMGSFPDIFDGSSG